MPDSLQSGNIVVGVQRIHDTTYIKESPAKAGTTTEASTPTMADNNSGHSALALTLFTVIAVGALVSYIVYKIVRRSQHRITASLKEKMQKDMEIMMNDHKASMSNLHHLLPEEINKSMESRMKTYERKVNKLTVQLTANTSNQRAHAHMENGSYFNAVQEFVITTRKYNHINDNTGVKIALSGIVKSIDKIPFTSEEDMKELEKAVLNVEKSVSDNEDKAVLDLMSSIHASMSSLNVRNREASKPKASSKLARKSEKTASVKTEKIAGMKAAVQEKNGSLNKTKAEKTPLSKIARNGAGIPVANVAKTANLTDEVVVKEEKIVTEEKIVKTAKVPIPQSKPLRRPSGIPVPETNGHESINPFVRKLRRSPMPYNNIPE
jgi:hypothetical protein